MNQEYQQIATHAEACKRFCNQVGFDWKTEDLKIDDFKEKYVKIIGERLRHIQNTEIWKMSIIFQTHSLHVCIGIGTRRSINSIQHLFLTSQRLKQALYTQIS